MWQGVVEATVVYNTSMTVGSRSAGCDQGFVHACHFQ